MLLIIFALYALVMFLGGKSFGNAAEQLSKKEYYLFGMNIMGALMYVALGIKLLLNI